jgi:antitoxin component YwqK of YwqJK toxin-antitoxin module
MRRPVLLILFLSLISDCPFAQDTSGPMLFVIDSIPLYNDPEPWNPITKEDIADMTVIRNRDSIRAFGWGEVAAVTFVFTKAYRNRPDSLKRIPSLKQMEQRNGAWYFKDTVYTGRYIDYYNSGRIQDEGALFDGMLNGEVTIYRKNGNRKTVSHYKEGKLEGAWNEYYPNGALSSSRNYKDGTALRGQKEYFINGRLMQEFRSKGKTLYDSIVYYYSDGRIKQTLLIINGVSKSKKAEDLSYYDSHFFQALNAGKLKDANKYYYKIWLIDSMSNDTHYKEGLLLLKEFRFDEAIVAFDRALAIEPLMKEALAYRALTRLKRNKYRQVNVFSKEFKEGMLAPTDLLALSAVEQERVCADLGLANDTDMSEKYIQWLLPFPALNYCGIKN